MATHQKRGNSYKITVSLGYDCSGKQIRKNTTWTPEPGMTPKQIEKELLRQKHIFEEKCKTGQVLDGGIRFADFYEIWLKEYAQRTMRTTTIEKNNNYIRRILPAIGHLKLEKIQPHHLLSFYSNLEEDGVRDDYRSRCTCDLKLLAKQNGINQLEMAEKLGLCRATIGRLAKGGCVRRGNAVRVAELLNVEYFEIFEDVDGRSGSKTLSSSTVRKHHELINTILRTAVRWGVIFSNPCDRVDPPKTTKPKPKYLDDGQARHVMHLLDNENPQYQAMIKLFIFTGFRRGELVGLEWDDIDFENSIIHVRRETLYTPGQGIYDDIGKTPTSLRSIKVPEDAIAVLKKYKSWQSEKRLMMGNKWVHTNRVFTANDGTIMNPCVISGWFAQFVKDNDLPDVSIHSLRHTNASLLIAGGAPITTVAQRLGHSNANMTTKTYAHAIKAADQVAADTLQDILNPTNKRA